MLSQIEQFGSPRCDPPAKSSRQMLAEPRATGAQPSCHVCRFGLVWLPVKVIKMLLRNHMVSPNRAADAAWEVLELVDMASIDQISWETGRMVGVYSCWAQ